MQYLQNWNVSWFEMGHKWWRLAENWNERSGKKSLSTKIHTKRWNSAILNYPLWAILQGLILNVSRPFELNIMVCNRWCFYYFYIEIDDKLWSCLKHTISIKLLPIVKLHDNTFAISKTVKPNLFSFFAVYLKWEYSRKIKRKESGWKTLQKTKIVHAK